MIRWTSSGAVSSPRTVQIRVQRRYPSRLQAGAPMPTRSLSEAELRANIVHFTAGMRTPRSAPCTALVLSGAGVVHRADIPDAIALARSEGVRWVTLHIDASDLTTLSPDKLPAADVVTIPARPDALDAVAAAVGTARAAGVRPIVSVALSVESVVAMPEIVAALRGAAPARVVLTYPFPTGAAAEVPPPEEAVAAVREALPLLAAVGIDASVKGLPACYLGDAGERLSRTINRWYVDADHQLGSALLFFPGVAAFYKAEVCRYCAADYRCDGFFREYLDRVGAQPLAPAY
ncbi:MAG: hypothetical protein ACI8S6_001295 [Myxococcota bacterium]|jgi:hypothetical protein